MTSKRRVSTSFAPEELLAAEATLGLLLRGGDVRVLVQRADFRRFAKSVQRLTERVHALEPAPRKVSKAAKILAKLREQQEPISSRALSALVGYTHKYVSEVLCDARDAGLTVRDGRGRTSKWSAVRGNVVQLKRAGGQ